VEDYFGMEKYFDNSSIVNFLKTTSGDLFDAVRILDEDPRIYVKIVLNGTEINKFIDEFNDFTGEGEEREDEGKDRKCNFYFFLYERIRIYVKKLLKFYQIYGTYLCMKRYISGQNYSVDACLDSFKSDIKQCNKSLQEIMKGVFYYRNKILIYKSLYGFEDKRLDRIVEKLKNTFKEKLFKYNFKVLTMDDFDV
jgi:hypothetical protein